MPLLKKLFESNTIVFVSLFALLLAVYSFSMQADFRIIDDRISIVENEVFTGPLNVKEIFSESFFKRGTYYRPLVMMSFYIEKHFFKLNVFYFHLTNIIFHSLAAFLVFLLTGMLTKRRTGLLIAVVYAFHPVHWEAVSSISGRAILLCAVFYLSALTLYVTAVRRKKQLFFPIAWGCFALSLLAKETAVTLLLIFLSFEYFFVFDKGQAKVEDSIKRVFPFFVILAGYFIARRIVGVTNIHFWPSISEQGLGIMTFLRSLLTYFRLIFLPLDLHFDRCRAYFDSWMNAELLLTLGIYVIGAGLLAISRQKISNTSKFFISWIALTFLPISQIVPITTQPGYAAVGEHLVYIPSIGMFALIILSYRKLEAYMASHNRPFTLIKAIFLSFYLFLFVTTIQQNIYASQEFAVLKQTLKHSPDNTRVRTAYATALALKKHYADAEQQYRMVLESEPWNSKARIGLGVTLCLMGKTLQGIKEYEKVSYAGKDKHILDNNLMWAYKQLIIDSQKKIKKDPGNAQGYHILGIALSKDGQLNEAIGPYIKALELDPDNQYVIFNLASVYNALGQTENAREFFKRFMDLDNTEQALRADVQKRLEELRSTPGF